MPQKKRGYKPGRLPSTGNAKWMALSMQAGTGYKVFADKFSDSEMAAMAHPVYMEKVRREIRDADNEHNANTRDKRTCPICGQGPEPIIPKYKSRRTYNRKAAA